MLCRQAVGMNSEPPPLPRLSVIRRLSVYFKIFGICLLILLLHVPLLMTHGVLTEREGYQSQAVDEIAGIWGHRQQVTGPVLAVPYAYKTTVMRAKAIGDRVVQVEEIELAPATAYFLPEKLVVTGPVEPEIRHRGIYQVVIYSAKLHLSGEFRPDFGAAGITADRIDWDKACVLFGVSDLRGIRSISPLQVAGGNEAIFEATDSPDSEFLPLKARINAGPAGAPVTLGLDVVLQGSERLEIVPAGKITTATLQSSWKNPSFTGAYLPAKHKIDAEGFQAEWEVSHFSRGFPQSWTNLLTGACEMQRKMSAASFGATFSQRADGYQLVERAEKYGVLFFVLIFAVFFLFEMTAALRIHPLQYTLVGAGLCLFFLGFLALSEFLEIGWAYGAAAAACTALISLYAWSILKTGRRTLMIFGGLATTYGYLYFVLKSQDYALLAGTVVLFAALAVMMFCTRRINWYAVDLNVSAPVAER
jgi:inner membrane protein